MGASRFRSRLVWLAVSVCALAAPRVLAGSALILTDGQVINGTEIRRDGDSYLVTMEGGSIVPFPAQLVKEIKLESDAPPKPPAGWDYGGPRQFAGSPIPTQNPADQLKVFGPPTRWSKDVVDTTWQPTDGFGFKPLSSKTTAATASKYPLTFSAPAPIPVASASSSGPSPWSCGESIFAKDHDAEASANRATSITVHALKEPRYTALGLPLYKAEAKVNGEKQEAIFTVAGGQCRLLGGDSDAILGMNLTPDHTMAQDAASFNAAMATRGGAHVPPGVDPLDFALAFLSVTDPTVSGSTAASLKLVASPDELKRIANATPTACAEGKSKKRKEARTAASSFAAPKIVASNEGDVATFLTWSSAGGKLCRNTVVLSRDGVVSARREVVAAHIGTHTD